MGITKRDIKFSEKHNKLMNDIDKGLKLVSGKLIAETKATNTYLVISDKKGNIKKIPAKDL